MTAPPTVSVIIAAYNAAPFIHRAVESALAQTGVMLEVLVVDDASNDDTSRVLEKLAQNDPRIKPVIAQDNKGPAGARNLALEKVTSDWIAVLDSDDSFQPDRLSRMVSAAKRQNADIVLDDFQPIFVNGEPVATADGLSGVKDAGSISAVDWVALNSFAQSQVSFGYAKPVLSTQFIRQSGLRYNDALRNGEDYHLILNALLNGASVYFTAQVGYNYTRRHGSVSHKAHDAHLNALLIADDQVAGMTDQITLRKWMNIRHENLRDLQATETFLRELKSGRVGRSVMALLKRPRAAGRVSRHLGEACAKRFGRRG